MPTQTVKKFSGDYKSLFSYKTEGEIIRDFDRYAFLASYFYNNISKTSFISCKESFNLIIWSNDYRTADVVPEFAFNIGKSNMENFIGLMNLVHKQWGLLKFSYIISDCGNLIFVRNPFWRKNVAHTELLSIFAKISKHYGHLFNLEAQDVRGVLDTLIKNGSTIYLTPQVLFVIDFGKKFVEHIYGIKPTESDKLYNKLFSFGCNGLITSLKDIAKTQPEKFVIAQ